LRKKNEFFDKLQKTFLRFSPELARNLLNPEIIFVAGIEELRPKSTWLYRVGLVFCFV
jgi:hypothetical protein